MKIRKFLMRNKELIQGISIMVQAIAIVALVVITGLYAMSTRNMADVMSKELEASNRPHVGIIGETHLRRDYRLDFIPKITNTGKVPAEIVSIETDIPNAKYLFDTIILHPTEERSPLIEINKPDINEDLPFLVKIQYYGVTKEREKYCIQYNYEIDGGNPEKVRLKSSEYCD